MALIQLPQANALVVDLGMHTVRMGFACDPCPICTIDVSALSQDKELSASTLAHAVYDEFRAKLHQYVAEPLPVFIAINHDVRPSFIFKLLDHFLSVFPGVAFHSAISCAAYASTQSTALIVDCGHTATRLALVVDGVIASVQSVSSFSGERLLGELLSVMDNKHTAVCNLLETSCDIFTRPTSTDLAFLAQKLLRELCTVSLEPQKDEEIATTTFIYEEEIKLPCGHTITLDKELFGIAEGMLQQSKLGTLILTTLETPSIAYQQSKGNIPVVMVGGLARLNNLTRRIQQDLRGKATVQSTDDAINAVWQGGASFVGIETLGDFLITRALLDEQGPEILMKVIM
ncbi:Actin related protein [Giardia lamblia P15]|uniref:Actin related protein n=1 Tax=Giardia intestinalis (strain P15) TaxID=658858 RepID=E1EWH4_GIAIA|nr:Actin related protein [Giardia lamblia P15]